MLQVCEDQYHLFNLNVNPDPVCPYNFTITVIDEINHGAPLAGATVDVHLSVVADGVATMVNVGERLVTDRNGQVVLPMNANGIYR